MGQYDTERIAAEVAHLDPTRIVDSASGWTDVHVGDTVDWHVYPGPGVPPLEAKRAAVLGEFGGLKLALEGHSWDAKSWGYQDTADSEELTSGYVELMRGVYELARDKGLCAVVYTQLSDVEIECNGLLTYDRKVIKVDAERVARANRGQFPTLVTRVPSARESAQEWRYRLDAPESERWFEPGYDDGAWKSGPSGFGTSGTPGAIVGTEWNTSEIWLRRKFEWTAAPSGEVRLLIHHDEDAQVWINGVLAAELAGYTSAYQPVVIRSEARAALVPGSNTLAIHCKQTRGGQYIDAGLVEIGGEGGLH
jgi:hypothetical protein